MSVDKIIELCSNMVVYVECNNYTYRCRYVTRDSFMCRNNVLFLLLYDAEYFNSIWRKVDKIKIVTCKLKKK